MNLKKYLKGKNREAFAAQIGTSKGYLNLIVCGARRPGANMALRIQRVTKGKVTIADALFPDGEWTR